MLRRVRFYHLVFVGAAFAAAGRGYAADVHMTNLASALDALSYVLLFLGFLRVLD